jgi:hypothetical protein
LFICTETIIYSYKSRYKLNKVDGECQEHTG